MKHTLIAFATFVVVLAGTSQTYAQRTFTFVIDGEKYSLEENKLNDLFGAAFNTIVERGVAKEKNFDLWAKTFNGWKDPVANGYWAITTYGDRISNSAFSGEISKQYLGWQSEGKTGTGNPNKESNLAARISIMYTYLSRNIVYYFTRKTIVN